MPLHAIEPVPGLYAAPTTPEPQVLASAAPVTIHMLGEPLHDPTVSTPKAHVPFAGGPPVLPCVMQLKLLEISWMSCTHIWALL